MNESFDAITAANAQAKYCEEHEVPMFAPANGMCNRCGRNIYEPYTVRHGTETVQLGITVEDAGKRLISGCPHCNATFVE